MSTGITVKFSNEYKATLCQLIDEEFKKQLLQGKRKYGLSVGFVFLTVDALELLARWASGNSPTRQNILKNKI